MKRSGRYAVSGMIEGQFEPGSRGRVLRNLIGIKSKREMNTVESRELVRTFRKLVGIHDQNHRFNYGLMEKIFDEVIERTLRLREQSFRSDSSGL